MKCEYCRTDIPEGSEVAFDGHYFCNSLHRRSWEKRAQGGDQPVSPTTSQSNSKRWGVIATAVFAVIGAIMGTKLATGVFGSSSSVDKQLVQVANEINKTCPFMIDKDTRLDNTNVGLGKTLCYNYTLVNLTSKEVNVAHLQEYLRPRVINNTRTNDDMRIVRENSVTLVYKYSDKDGNKLLEVKVTPDDYR